MPMNDMDMSEPEEIMASLGATSCTSESPCTDCGAIYVPLPSYDDITRVHQPSIKANKSSLSLNTTCGSPNNQDLQRTFNENMKHQPICESTLSMAPSLGLNNAPICRICHQTEEESEYVLISPCRCMGSMQFIHNTCLLRWLAICTKRSRKPAKCELCQYVFHRHKQFKRHHWRFPNVSRRDTILHVCFLINVFVMIVCAVATVMCFLSDRGQIRKFPSNKKTDIDVGNAQHQEAATSIQSKYRQHHATKVVQEKREERAATSIQASFRGYQDRQLVKGMKGGSVVADKAEDDANLGELELESDASAKDKQAKAEGFKSRQIAGEVEEEVDIDLNDPETEKAAICIQAGYKGYKSRKEVTAIKDNETPAVGGDEPQTETAPAGDDGVDDIDLNDPEVEAAAIAIQAGYKGFKARKSLKGGDEEVAEDSKPEAAEVKAGEEEEEIDIDLEDPEVEAAAIKIQASFKGFKSRKEQQNEAEPEEGKVEQAADGDKPAEEVNQAEGKPETVAEPSAEESAKPQQEQEEEIDIDLNDPEVEDAAIKIQAGFKNFKQRQSIKAENVETDPAEPAAPTEEPVPEATDGDVKDEA